MIALTAALDGICTIWSPDGSERRVPVTEFVTGPQRNLLKPGDLLSSIALPAAALTRRTAFRQISLAPLGRSAALLIGTRAPRDGSFTLTVTAATPHPVKLGFQAVPSATELHARIEHAIGGYYDDIHGAPEWRRHMTLYFAEDIRRELASEPLR
jgi:CO/xanthine dehydrogenase FAD-binding subunit